MKHFNCVDVSKISYGSNCLWFAMRNLLLNLLTVFWESIVISDYEYFRNCSGSDISLFEK